MVMSLLESLYKSLYKNVKDPALSIFRSPWRPEKSCVFAAAVLDPIAVSWRARPRYPLSCPYRTRPQDTRPTRKCEIFTTSKPLCRSISRYFIRFLEKDSSRKLIFFPIFGRRFLEKDDFQKDPLLFETRPTPSCKKMADGLAADAQKSCISNRNIH